MRWLLACSLLVGILLLPAVDAHAEYHRSEPARNARLPQPPSFASVTLSEGIDRSGSDLEVRDCHGEPVPQGPVQFSGAETPTLRVDFDAPLPNGSYQGNWKALSSVDGHITSGTWGFVVGFGAPCPEKAAAQDYSPLSAVARALLYAGYALCFGVVGFVLLVHQQGLPAPRRAWTRMLGVGGALTLLGLSGLVAFTIDAVGLGPEGFLATNVGKEFAARLVVAATIFLVCMVGLRTGASRRILWALAPLLLVSAAGNSLFAHSAQQGWWASAVDWLHLVSVSLWLGGLGLFLHFILHARRHGTYEHVMWAGRRFSRLALTCVVILGLTGLVSSVLIVGWSAVLDPVGLGSTPYGFFLLGKVALFGAMVALAGINRFVFLGERAGPDHARPTRHYESLEPGPGHSRPFSRAVGLEASLGVVVLVLAGFLTAISPPAVLATSEGLLLQNSGTDHNVTLSIAPAPSLGRYGNLTLRIEVSETGEPLNEAIRVRVRIAAAGANESAGESYTASPMGDGGWLVGDILFARAGAHEARIEIQTEDVYSDVIMVPFDVA